MYLLLSRSTLCFSAAGWLHSIMEIPKVFHSLGLTDSLPLRYEFMPAQPVPPSHKEVSRGVIWAFSSVGSFEINCTHIVRQKGRGGREREGKTETDRRSSEPNSRQIRFLICLWKTLPS